MLYKALKQRTIKLLSRNQKIITIKKCNDRIERKLKNKQYETNTVELLYYGHQGHRNKCPYYRGDRFREVAFKWISVSQGTVRNRGVRIIEVSVRRGSAVGF